MFQDVPLKDDHHQGEIDRMAQQLPTLTQENSKKIRVLAADSTRMSSQLLADALAQDSRFEVRGIEPKRISILEAVAQQMPDIVLVSSVLEGSATLGFELTRQLRSAHADVRVVLLMDASHSSLVIEAFRCGARGVFSRTESSKTLAKCIHSVYQGQVWANSAELRYLLEALRESEPIQFTDSRGEAILSKREQDVVRCVAEGLSNREIATRLQLTEHTVKNYLFRIFDKLGVSSRVEVVLYAFRFRKDLVDAPLSADFRSTALGPILTKPFKPNGEAPLRVKRAAAPVKELAYGARITLARRPAVHDVS
jgi:two-component system nitrate/nitrite response regulator NarL